MAAPWVNDCYNQINALQGQHNDEQHENILSFQDANTDLNFLPRALPLGYNIMPLRGEDFINKVIRLE